MTQLEEIPKIPLRTYPLGKTLKALLEEEGFKEVNGARGCGDRVGAGQVD